MGGEGKGKSKLEWDYIEQKCMFIQRKLKSIYHAFKRDKSRLRDPWGLEDGEGDHLCYVSLPQCCTLSGVLSLSSCLYLIVWLQCYLFLDPFFSQIFPYLLSFSTYSNL